MVALPRSVLLRFEVGSGGLGDHPPPVVHFSDRLDMAE